MEKRERGTNFTSKEKELLINLVDKYKYCVECKITNGAIWREKAEKWEELTKEFNATSCECPRSCKTLKQKYESLKKEARKKLSGSCSKKITFDHVDKQLIAILDASGAGLRPRCDSDVLIEPEPQPSITQCDVELRENCFNIKIEEVEIPEIIPPVPVTSPISIKSAATSEGRSEDASQVIICENTSQHPNNSVSKKRKNKLNTNTITKDAMQLSTLKKELIKKQIELTNEELKSKKLINKLTIESLMLDIELKKKLLDRKT